MIVDPEIPCSGQCELGKLQKKVGKFDQFQPHTVKIFPARKACTVQNSVVFGLN